MPAWIAAMSASESGLVKSTPCASAAKHGPIWRVVTGMADLPLGSSTRSTQMRDARRYLLHQEAQALVVPPGIVRVRRDREQRAEAAALLVELVDLLRALHRVADDPDVLHQVVDGDRLVRHRGRELRRRHLDRAHPVGKLMLHVVAP